jgi:hypothetical protein
MFTHVIIGLCQINRLLLSRQEKGPGGKKDIEGKKENAWVG